MDPLRLSAPASVALNALKPIPPPPPPAAAPSAGLTEATAVVQGLARDLFQRSLQRALVFPLAEEAAPPTDLMPGFTGNLLTALSPPQATGEATPVPAATVTPAAITPPATLPVALPGELQASPAQETGASLDFALQTALRFGAGVGALALPVAQAPSLGVELVRDAVAVARQRPLQSQAGGPGPEAFAPPPAPVQQVLRSYQAPVETPRPGALDVLA